MPNAETVRALINVFNVYNHGRNTVETNFTLQSSYMEDCIVVSFDKGMKDYQCSEYLYNIKRKIVSEFYAVKKEDTDEVVLNTANLIFNIESFPFNTSKGKWSQDEQGRIEFLAPIDQGVIFNLKSHLASSLKKDVIESMPICHMVTEAFNKEKYLCHSKFPNKELCKEFEHKFLLRMRERYENVPKNPLKVKGDDVYIKDIFNDARFIDSVTRRVAWLEGMYLGVDSSTNHKVKLFKDMIVESIGQSTGVTIYGFVCASPLGREEASILIPLVLDSGRKRMLTNKEALKLNYAFNYAVFNDLYGRTQGELLVNGSNVVYGIDFSNKEISHCVITKIIESSVINERHELSIDPELHLRALSPPGTPPNQRKADTDSGYDSNSPPKPKDSGSSSGGPGPSTELSNMECESPTRSQDGALEGSPRQGSEKSLLHNSVNLAGTSKGFPPLPQLNSIAVSYGVSGPSKSGGNLGAAAVSGSIPGPLLWSQSEPSSSKDANKGMSTWTSQPMNHWSSPASSAGSSLWSQSGASSSRGAGKICQQGVVLGVCHHRLLHLTTRNDPISSNFGIFADPPEDTENICSMKEKQQVTKEKEKENLFKVLLYSFNLNNYILEYPNTNFIVKNGKIASSIHDGVNVKEYLEELKKFMREKYYRTEEKAKKACDLNEFPFEFLSNCEKNQETTVVANISRGALSNLKKLFIREHEGKVEIGDIDININIVEKAVKSKKDIWVNSQVQGLGVRTHEAILDCYPDESKLEHIPIIKDKGGYCLDRTYGDWEVELFLKEQQCTKGTSVAKKRKLEDNKDSGISSGEATDDENVSSKAEATTSGYESMDCENTRGGSPKHTLELSVENLRISTKLDATKAEQYSPIKKFRSN